MLVTNLNLNFTVTLIKSPLKTHKLLSDHWAMVCKMFIFFFNCRASGTASTSADPRDIQSSSNPDVAATRYQHFQPHHHLHRPIQRNLS